MILLKAPLVNLLAFLSLFQSFSTTVSALLMYCFLPLRSRLYLLSRLIKKSFSAFLTTRSQKFICLLYAAYFPLFFDCEILLSERVRVVS